MKKTALKRGTPLRATKGLGRRSPLRSRPSGRARPEEPLADRCEARVTPFCRGRAEHRHHRRLRAQGGSDARSNTIDVCVRCHAWIHLHPAEAAARGLLVLGAGKM